MWLRARNLHVGGDVADDVGLVRAQILRTEKRAESLVVSGACGLDSERDRDVFHGLDVVLSEDLELDRGTAGN